MESCGLEGRLPGPVTGSEGHWRLPVAPSRISCTMSEYRDTTSIYTDIAHDIVHDVVIRHPYIPICVHFSLRYRLVFFDIVVNIGWQGFRVWSVLISGYDIVYDDERSTPHLSTARPQPRPMIYFLLLKWSHFRNLVRIFKKFSKYHTTKINYVSRILVRIFIKFSNSHTRKLN